MEYRNINNLQISRLTLGTAQLGSAYGVANLIGKPDHKTAVKILSTAAEHGINCFDTALTYGNSEDEVGSFITNYHGFLYSPVIITKLPKINISEKINYHSIYMWITNKIFTSMSQLKLKRIPIYLLHNASDLALYDGLVIESLLKLKSQDLINLIGVSVYTPQDVELALNVKGLDVIQVPLNLFDSRLVKLGLLDQLVKKGILILARSIFLQGLFFLDNKRLPEYLELAKKPLNVLRELSHFWDIDIKDMSIRFVRDLPGVTSVIIGAETPDQILENIKLINSPPLPEKLKEEIINTFSDLPLELINPGLWKIK